MAQDTLKTGTKKLLNVLSVIWSEELGLSDRQYVLVHLASPRVHHEEVN